MKRLFLIAIILIGATLGIAAQQAPEVDPAATAETLPSAPATDSIAAAPAATVEMADSAYNADNFQLAATLYNEVMATEGTSAKLYYNLGNTYYRLGQPGKAIIAYERALRLNPADDDARENLAFVNSRITDRPGERGTFFGNALDSIATATRSNVWAVIALVCFVLTLAGVLAYMLSSSVPLRKTGFFGGIASLIVCGICLFFASRSASLASADNIAIVTAPSTILSTVPRLPQDRNQEAMLLHEGTRVTILNSVRSTTDSVNPLWYDVEIDNAHRAWINANAVEII